MTAAPEEAKIRGLTFSTATEEDRRHTRESWRWADVAAFAGVLVCISFAYIYFRG